MGKIIGRPVVRENKTILSPNAGIPKAKIDRSATRNKIETYTGANKHLQILVLNSLVARVQLYELKIMPPRPPDR